MRSPDQIALKCSVSVSPPIKINGTWQTEHPVSHSCTPSTWHTAWHKILHKHNSSSRKNWLNPTPNNREAKELHLDSFLHALLSLSMTGAIDAGETSVIQMTGSQRNEYLMPVGMHTVLRQTQ